MWTSLPNVSLTASLTPEDTAQRSVEVPRDPIIYRGPSSWKVGTKPWEVTCQVLQTSLGLLSSWRTKGLPSWFREISSPKWTASKLKQYLTPGQWVSVDKLEERVSRLSKSIKNDLRGVFRPFSTGLNSQSILAAPGPSHRKLLKMFHDWLIGSNLPSMIFLHWQGLLENLMRTLKMTGSSEEVS